MSLCPAAIGQIPNRRLGPVFHDAKTAETKSAARAMKPERQAEVDLIPPVYLNYYRFLLSETIKPKLRFKLFYDQD